VAHTAPYTMCTGSLSRG